ncbi:hypothetical protein D3C71_1599880 [compost metagenome]
MPSLAMANSTRVEAYMPELPADSTELRMTAFMTEAATASPALLKTIVNGLIPISSMPPRSRSGFVYGMIMPMTKMARM